MYSCSMFVALLRRLTSVAPSPLQTSLSYRSRSECGTVRTVRVDQDPLAHDPSESIPERYAIRYM